jgi:O-glycosyl hydrolase
MKTTFRNVSLLAAALAWGCGTGSGLLDAGSGGAAASGGGASATGGLRAMGGGLVSGGGAPQGGRASGSGGANSGGVLGEIGGSSSGGLFTSGSASAVGGAPPSSGGAGPRPTVVAEPGTTLVKLDPAQKHQRFEGWGTSLCWWADRVGRWSQAGRAKLVEALVDSEAGLGLNIYRYNIGGGENPSHTHMDEYKDIPGFQSQDGTFHPEADPYQRAVLLDLTARQKDLILEAFSNSPPYFMTKSGCASGSSDGSDNLKSDAYEPFANYLTDVVKLYKESYGVVFRTLEPLNEPSANWWKSNGGQEGCHFGRASQEKLIALVQQQLQAKGLTETSVSAADENSIDDAYNNLKAFSAATVAAIGQVNVHSYNGTKRKELRALATSLNKRLWQSESGPLSVEVADDIEAALFMGGRILADLRDMEAEAWVDWQVGDVSRNWGSFTLDDKAESYKPLKRFYVQANYSRFIRPGAEFVLVNSTDMVAALAPDGRSLTVIVRNGDAKATRGYTFDLTQLPSVGASLKAFRTSRTEDLAAQPNVSIEGYRVVVTAPPNSLTTLVIPFE